MADDAPRAAAPDVENQLLDTKTVNDSSASLDELTGVTKDAVDAKVLVGELTGVVREARGAADDVTDNAVKAANQTDIDAAGKVNEDTRAGALGAMPHLGGLPIG
ncbi:hypothetical protein [Streptomyces sp. N35]|uniref:hypothetical protein n=1 Tax=Streptomyces sp. N35 TaxID=2795730 RepID=UPI0018F5DDF0|nr:hypothetical protein [Streptomyces sp. N35]